MPKQISSKTLSNIYIYIYLVSKFRVPYILVWKMKFHALEYLRKKLVNEMRLRFEQDSHALVWQDLCSGLPVGQIQAMGFSQNFVLANGKRDPSGHF